MARKKVVELNADNCVGFGTNEGQIRPGKTVDGYYLGARKVETGMGPSTLHFLQTESGNLGVWGSAQLNSKLAQIQTGTRVFITYVKKIKAKLGMMKVFDVEYDDEDTIEVSNTAVSFNPGNEDSSDDSADDAGFDANEDDFASDDVADVEPKQTLTKPTQTKVPTGNLTAANAASLARAEALLGKKR